MRLRQGPLLEASIIYVVASFLSFITFLATSAGDLNAAFGIVSVEAILLLLPSFVLWALIGIVTKNRSVRVRFLSQVSVSTIVVLLGILLINQVGQAKGQSVSIEQLMGIWYVVSATYFITALIGSIFSNFWFVRKAQKARALEAAKTKGK
jgi:hypothetical protein